LAPAAPQKQRISIWPDIDHAGKRIFRFMVSRHLEVPGTAAASASSVRSGAATAHFLPRQFQVERVALAAFLQVMRPAEAATRALDTVSDQPEPFLRGASDEAIQKNESALRSLDCFASLAITEQLVTDRH
jgi:hypothetical protein